MKAKGLVVKDFPSHWTDWQNPNKPNNYFTKEEIEFNNKLLVDKRPYFMKYLYSTYKAQYNAHRDKYDYLCYRTFGIHIDELLNIENKTEEQQNLANNYKRFNPFIESDCPMNRICKYMEKEIKEIKLNIRKSSPDYIYDMLYNKDLEVTEEQIKQMDKFYKAYKKNRTAKDNIIIKNDDELNDIKFSTELLNISKLDYISDNIQVLANLAVYVNYQMYPNSPKSFCWDLFSDGILLNIYDNSNKDFYIPLETIGGDIEYMGKQYQNKKVVIDYDNF